VAVVSAVPTPPSISFSVPGQVHINAGDVYDRCAADAPISAVCERGVAADDDKDGNMERQVLVCGSRCAQPSSIEWRGSAACHHVC
jgi:hypothetical protein